MRDSKRIDEFCQRLAVCWKRYPDLRFGQFMMNIFGKMLKKGRDPFFPEEEEMIKFIEEYTGVK